MTVRRREWLSLHGAVEEGACASFAFVEEGSIEAIAFFHVSSSASADRVQARRGRIQARSSRT